MDSKVSSVRQYVEQASSTERVCEMRVRVDLEMKKAIGITLVVIWVWVTVIFGPKCKH